MIVDRRQLRDELSRTARAADRGSPLRRPDVPFPRARPATLAAWLAHLETLHPKAIAMGLDRVAAVRCATWRRTLACPVVTVTGTNGKGSTCAMLEAMLRCAGLSHRPLHVAASPRATTSACASTATPAADDALVAAFNAVEDARADVPLTYFEFGTLAAFWLFARADLDGGDPRGGSGRTARRGQRHRRRRGRRDERRPRSHGLPRPDARGHRAREGRHLSRRPSRGLRRAESAGHAARAGARARRAAHADRPRLRICRRRRPMALLGPGRTPPRPAVSGAARRDPARQCGERARGARSPARARARGRAARCATGLVSVELAGPLPGAAGTPDDRARRRAQSARRARARRRRSATMGFHPRTIAVFGMLADKDIDGVVAAHVATHRPLARRDAARRRVARAPPTSRAALLRAGIAAADVRDVRRRRVGVSRGAGRRGRS